MISPLHPLLRSLAKARLVRLLASLKLAMLLLGILIVACVVGTVAESRLDTVVAQAYVYDAPWFAAWLLLLCANLTCSVLVRYPWKGAQWGFIVTHAGIILLLAGALVGRIWGIEGNVTLYKGAPPETQLVVNEMVLQVQATGMATPVARSIDLRLHPPTPERPVHWKTSLADLSVLGYSEQLRPQEAVETSAVAGAPGIRVRLKGAMAPNGFVTWLVLGEAGKEKVNLGPITLYLKGDPESWNVEAGVGGQPETSVGTGSSTPAVSRERYFAFAKMADMSMSRVLAGEASGIKARYQFVPGKTEARDGSLTLEVDGRQFEFVVAEVLQKKVPLEGTSWSLEGLRFLPDFRMQGKDAVSASDQPNNPAVVFEIVGLSGAGAECHHASQDCSSDSADQKGCCAKPAQTMSTGLTFYYEGPSKLRYVSVQKGQKRAVGEVTVGEEFAPGLGDWAVAVEEVAAHVQVREELRPVTAGASSRGLTSGVLVRLEKGGEQMERWVGTGAPVSLMIGGKTAVATFGYRQHPLGFEVALEAFEVERNEGTQTPAGFKSHVRFLDPATGAKIQREVWMNHPAIFPEFPGASLLGTSYKFSQASWNPDNLNQTTLQVLRDPGWSLKWIGSLLLCVGLFGMFYLKPSPRRPALQSA